MKRPPLLRFVSLPSNKLLSAVTSFNKTITRPFKSFTLNPDVCHSRYHFSFEPYCSPSSTVCKSEVSTIHLLPMHEDTRRSYSVVDMRSPVTRSVLAATPDHALKSPGDLAIYALKSSTTLREVASPKGQTFTGRAGFSGNRDANRGKWISVHGKSGPHLAPWKERNVSRIKIVHFPDFSREIIF